MKKRAIKPVLDKVIQFTIENPYERDYWEKAPALHGILAWDRVDSVVAIQDWVDRAVETQTTDGFLNYGDPIVYHAGHAGSITPTAILPAVLGYPVLRFYEKTGDQAYLDAAHRQAEAFKKVKRTRDGAYWSRVEGPELWIDFLYMMCPFMIRYGQIAGDDDFINESFEQYELYVKRLVDSEHHLARHAWCETPNHFPQSTFWLRGHGWLIVSAVDMLTLSPDHPKAPFVKQVLKDGLIAASKYQDASGYFHHVLDDPLEQKEASGTLMYAYAVAHAIEMGIVDDTMLESALRAFNVVVGSVESSGKVPGVAVPPGGPGVPFGWTLFGQGFFMLAAHALRDHLDL